MNILRLDLWIISGNEIYSNNKLVIFYAGSEENKNFIMNLAFNESFQEKYLGKSWLWGIPKNMRDKKFCHTLFICEVYGKFMKVFRKENCFYIPCWIEGEVDTNSSLRRDSFKTDLRRIRKNRLEYHITKKLNHFDDFYYNMYLPYISQTFGNRAVISNYDYLKSNFREKGLYSELLLVKKYDENIAGTLLGFDKTRSHLSHIGIKNANSEYVKNGAIGALFYFPVLHSKEKGYKTMSLGLARTFLNDGVLQFKKKRGMRIINSINVYFLVQPQSATDGVKGFFLNNPFIYMSDNKLYGAIFMDNGHRFSNNYFERVYKDYYLKGMSNLNIFYFGDTNKTQKFIPKEYSEKMKIYPAENLICLSDRS
jgi:hypothetical protein